ncbi:LTA synthase family protein [Daejeonella sp.]|uniref:LTA synthase family protein n=1 Tax=Daejeonella sp. TaxID=2805397 RepID=UPI0027B8DDD3|nr:alkaline phosphatase family protein [Daejeonella sp.]
MLKSFIVFGRFFLFWIVFFFLERFIFLVYFSDRISYLQTAEILSTFWRALRLDISMAAYISVLPAIFYIILLFLPSVKIPKIIAKSYVIFFVTLFSTIAISNLNLYREWGSKINYRAVDMAFNSPKEAIASTSSSPLILLFSILFAYLVCSIYISSKFILYKIADRTKSLGIKLTLSFLVLITLFLAIRGGWQLTPINQSMAYFSNNIVLNHAAVNTEWNLIQDVINNKFDNENPYKYYEKYEAKKIVSSLFKKPSQSTVKVLKSERPNIVLIVLESFTAELIGSLGGEQGVTPNIDNLAAEGILFEQVYAAAGRTDKGITATISGFPAQAIRSIIKQNAKHEKLPGIAQELAFNSYSTSFYYGGESEFFNIKSYILSHGYKTLVDKHSFLSKDMNSKWGTYDEKVFSKQMKDMDTVKQPFFSTILTLTNHEPFELPVKSHFPGDNVENKFRSTTFYTDSCLGAYLKEAKKKPWYKNTLFVILADHSHRLPANLAEHDPRRYRIPLLFFGNMIKPEFRGTRISKTGNQTDLVATILNQLNIDPIRYKWSKDLLNPGTQSFSFFNWDNGFGFVTENQIISFDNVGKKIILRKNSPNNKIDNELLKNGKAYMQEAFQQYLDY